MIMSQTLRPIAREQRLRGSFDGPVAKLVAKVVLTKLELPHHLLPEYKFFILIKIISLITDGSLGCAPSVAVCEPQN